MRDWRAVVPPVLAVVVLAIAACGARSSSNAVPHVITTTTAPYPRRILVFSRTAAFRHTSIPTAVAAVTEIATSEGLGVDASEDPGVFTDDNLARYGAVVFLLTTGDVLDPLQQAAFERYIRSGRGYVGVHSASDTEYDWPFYATLVGAQFKRHPALQEATINVENGNDASTHSLPRPWVWTDEWYDFRVNPRAGVHVLLTVDETTYRDGGMGSDHPIAWCHDVAGGRAWYTALGHAEAAYADPRFRAHLLGGINDALGASRCS